MKARIILLITLFLTSGFSVFSQSFGLRGGIHYTDQTVKNDYVNLSDNFTSEFGYHFGTVALIPINSIFSIETGAYLFNKNSSYSESGQFLPNPQIIDFELIQNISTYYIDIPVLLRTDFKLGLIGLFAAAGPYVSVGLQGVEEETIKYLSPELEDKASKRDINWGSSQDDDFKRFDYGAMINIGITLDRMQLGLFASLGFANIAAYSTNNETVNVRNFGINFGYNFLSDSPEKK